jgi:hypothetical protein
VFEKRDVGNMYILASSALSHKTSAYVLGPRTACRIHDLLPVSYARKLRPVFDHVHVSFSLLLGVEFF